MEKEKARLPLKQSGKRIMHSRIGKFYRFLLFYYLGGCPVVIFSGSRLKSRILCWCF